MKSGFGIDGLDFDRLNFDESCIAPVQQLLKQHLQLPVGGKHLETEALNVKTDSGAYFAKSVYSVKCSY